MSNEASILSSVFDAVLQKKYGSVIAPAPYLTAFGIRHFDALLGGGISSSLPVCVSSTPETGEVIAS
jgi:hypothetical protein